MKLTRFRGHSIVGAIAPEEVHDGTETGTLPAGVPGGGHSTGPGGGKSIGQVAKDLGIADQSLRNWVKQADLDAGRRTDGLTTEERAEFRRLRRENRVLKEERAILVKAAAFFAQETHSKPGRPSSS